jgi:hypothetical protein
MPLETFRYVILVHFTIADITALVAIDFGGRLADIQIAPSLTHQPASRLIGDALDIPGLAFQSAMPI